MEGHKDYLKIKTQDRCEFSEECVDKFEAITDGSEGVNIPHIKTNVRLETKKVRLNVTEPS